MKKLNYKLIVSDFDGTLIDDNGKISPEVNSAINEYVACGGIFAVCTGRMLCSILPTVRDLGLKGLVVAHQGTVIAEIESGKLIKYGGMKSRDVAEVCKHLEELNRLINVYSDDVMYTTVNKNESYLKIYEDIVGIDSKYVDGKMSEFVVEKDLFCQKVSVLVAPEEREWLYEELSKRLGKKFDVTCSASVLVEISPLSDNKGEALKFLAKHYNVPIEKTVAAGDNLNDLPMVKAAGIGVAVGNATEKLKEAADFVSVTNNQGAVAQIIKKYGFA
ncbi:MAG: HAD family phosphatase [Clostridia bacterium]|nr:HAD family phosphatase [Clostridia bacterium]